MNYTFIREKVDSLFIDVDTNRTITTAPLVVEVAA